jgi:hypothetical protein
MRLLNWAKENRRIAANPITLSRARPGGVSMMAWIRARRGEEPKALAEVILRCRSR